jgi:hypothetical protein
VRSFALSTSLTKHMKNWKPGPQDGAGWAGRAMVSELQRKTCSEEGKRRLVAVAAAGSASGSAQEDVKSCTIAGPPTRSTLKERADEYGGSWRGGAECGAVHGQLW